MCTTLQPADVAAADLVAVVTMLRGSVVTADGLLLVAGTVELLVEESVEVLGRDARMLDQAASNRMYVLQTFRVVACLQTSAGV